MVLRCDDAGGRLDKPSRVGLWTRRMLLILHPLATTMPPWHLQAKGVLCGIVRLGHIEDGVDDAYVCTRSRPGLGFPGVVLHMSATGQRRSARQLLRIVRPLCKHLNAPVKPSFKSRHPQSIPSQHKVFDEVADVHPEVSMLPAGVSNPPPPREPLSTNGAIHR